MEKIKNFFYDKSDLIVAMAIIAAAALVIWFGINNIMDPEKNSADAKNQVSQAEQTENTNQETQNVTPEAAGTTTPQATTPAGTVAAKIIISNGDGSDQIADKLLASGAITDKNAFFAKLEELGLSSKIQLGTFDIPAGSSLDDVCKIITKTN